MGTECRKPAREGVMEVALAVAIFVAFAVWTWPIYLIDDTWAESVAAMWGETVSPIKTWLGVE